MHLNLLCVDAGAAPALVPAAAASNLINTFAWQFKTPQSFATASAPTQPRVDQSASLQAAPEYPVLQSQGLRTGALKFTAVCWLHLTYTSEAVAANLRCKISLSRTYVFLVKLALCDGMAGSRSTCVQPTQVTGALLSRDCVCRCSFFQCPDPAKATLISGWPCVDPIPHTTAHPAALQQFRGTECHRSVSGSTLQSHSAEAEHPNERMPAQAAIDS